MNPAYISAFAALAGAIIGGLTSFATSWFTQRAQLQNADRQAQRAKLEALYNEYISVAAGLYAAPAGSGRHRPDTPARSRSGALVDAAVVIDRIASRDTRRASSR